MDRIEMQVSDQHTAMRRQRPELECFNKLTRKAIESTFSAITSLFGHHIHETTFQGSRLKLCLFLLAFTINKAALL